MASTIDTALQVLQHRVAQLELEVRRQAEVERHAAISEAILRVVECFYGTNTSELLALRQEVGQLREENHRLRVRDDEDLICFEDIDPIAVAEQATAAVSDAHIGVGLERAADAFNVNSAHADQVGVCQAHTIDVPFEHEALINAERFDAKTCRAVLISNLPADLSYPDLVDKIHGGALASVVITDTRSITCSPTALVTFVNAQGAQRFSESNHLAFSGRVSPITLIDSPTFRRKQGLDDTRCLELSALPRSYNSDNYAARLWTAVTAHDEMAERHLAQHIVHAIFTAHRSIIIQFTSIRAAKGAFAVLSRHGDFRYATFRFVKDPCDPDEKIRWQMDTSAHVAIQSTFPRVADVHLDLKEVLGNVMGA